MKRKNTTGIPDFELESLARGLLPAIQEYYKSEKNNAEFKLWQAENKKAKRKTIASMIQGGFETTISGAVSIIHPIVYGDGYISIEKQRNEINKFCKIEYLCVLKEYIAETNFFIDIGKKISEYISEVDFCKTIIFPKEPSTDINNLMVKELQSVLKRDDIIIKPFYIKE